MSATLEVRDLYVGYYKDLNILQGVSITAQKGKLTAILGANGVGKSTLLRLFTAFCAPMPGRFSLTGRTLWMYPHSSAFGRVLRISLSSPAFSAG